MLDYFGFVPGCSPKGTLKQFKKNLQMPLVSRSIIEVTRSIWNLRLTLSVKELA